MKYNHNDHKFGSWRQPILWTLVLSGGIAIGGCTSPGDVKLTQPKQVSQYHYDKVFKELHAIDWPKDTWWKRYQDPQLNELISEALSDSPSIHMAQARLKQARGIARQVGALQHVTGGLSASASEAKASYAYQSYVPESKYGWNDYGTIGLDFSYDIDFWGKNRSAVEASISNLAATEAETASARLMLSTSVANAYAELARLYANQDTVQEAVQVRQKTVELLKKRYKNGLETQGAVSQARSSAASVAANLLGINEAISLQKNALAALLGKGPDRGLQIKRPQVHLGKEFGLPKNAGVGLIGHRPDLTAARWRAQAAASRVGVAKAQFYPDVKLSAFIGYQAFGIDNLFSSDTSAGGVGPAIYLPLFSGGRLKGQLTAAEAQYDQAVDSYQQTLTEALHEVADVVTSSRSLDARINKTQQAVDAARDAYNIADNRYKGGLATYLDVLTAQDALLANQRALVNLQSRAFSLDLQLVHALGGGYQYPQS